MTTPPRPPRPAGTTPARLSANQRAALALVAAGRAEYRQATGGQDSYVADLTTRGARVHPATIGGLWSRSLVRQVGITVRIGGPAAVRLQLTREGEDAARRARIPFTPEPCDCTPPTTLTNSPRRCQTCGYRLPDIDPAE